MLISVLRRSCIGKSVLVQSGLAAGGVNWAVTLKYFKLLEITCHNHQLSVFLLEIGSELLSF
jgi:hypothetical protein